MVTAADFIRLHERIDEATTKLEAATERLSLCGPCREQVARHEIALKGDDGNVLGHEKRLDRIETALTAKQKSRSVAWALAGIIVGGVCTVVGGWLQGGQPRESADQTATRTTVEQNHPPRAADPASKNQP